MKRNMIAAKCIKTHAAEMHSIPDWLLRAKRGNIPTKTIVKGRTFAVEDVGSKKYVLLHDGNEQWRVLCKHVKLPPYSA